MTHRLRERYASDSPTRALFTRALFTRALFTLALFSVTICGLAAPSKGRALDPFAAGDGSDGSLYVSQPDVVVNAYSPLTADLLGDERWLRVQSATDFSQDDLVMVWQHGGELADSPGLSMLSMAPDSQVGSYALARVVQVQEGRLELAWPIGQPFQAAHSQVVFVPEYSMLTVAARASLTAAPFDGQSGGVLALMVSGAALIDGSLVTVGLGHTGGQVGSAGDAQGCALSAPAMTDAAEQGSSSAPFSALTDLFSTERRYQGGGGGGCASAGGGGGGGAGAGGDGGDGGSDPASVTGEGGAGGLALDMASLSLLMMGGGGGAGHGSDSDGPGGDGGGAVLMRASNVRGFGWIDASGESAPEAAVGGGGGGGAGGSIRIETVDEVCIDHYSLGGDGARAKDDGGSGGGGGGGLVQVLASALDCSTAEPVLGGLGLAVEIGGVLWGAASGEAGAVQRDADRPLRRDSDADGLLDLREGALDQDSDGLANFVDADDDDDGIDSRDEQADPNGDGDPADARDTDDDGLVDYLDPDDDDDGVASRYEDAETDTDLDGRPDHLDSDDDDDGIPTSQESADPDGNGDPRDARSTLGTLADFLNPDDDGDGLQTRLERPEGLDVDRDGDGLPDHLDPDDDDDGLETSREVFDDVGQFSPDRDQDGDGIADYLDDDDDGDGIPTLIERRDALQFGLGDLDGDGLAPYLDPDADGDGVEDTLEWAWEPESPAPEGTPPAYLDPRRSPLDADGDGLSDRLECPIPEACVDSDGDGLADMLDPDDDGDGVPTFDEGPASVDTDGDGLADYLDPDDDGDGIATALEVLGPPQDSDGDGIFDHLDADDDDDGIPTLVEAGGAVGGALPDQDGDGVPDHLDQDSDGDGVLDGLERATALAAEADALAEDDTELPAADPDAPIEIPGGLSAPAAVDSASCSLAPASSPGPGSPGGALVLLLPWLLVRAARGWRRRRSSPQGQPR